MVNDVVVEAAVSPGAVQRIQGFFEKVGFNFQKFAANTLEQQQTIDKFECASLLLLTYAKSTLENSVYRAA